MTKHKKCKSKNDNRGKIPDTINIPNRPLGAKNRSRFGHWKSDIVLGMRKTGLLGTHVERKSGYLLAFKLNEKTDEAFNKATIKLFENILL